MPSYVTSRIAPDGTPRLAPTGTPDGLGDAARTQLADAFAEGPAAALLHLGGTEPDNRAIPAPLGFRRDVGKLFVTRLCASPDLLHAADGLVPIRGRWVELDRERLREVLAHWRGVQREAAAGGLSFLDGMRLLAGAPIGRAAASTACPAPFRGRGSHPRDLR